MQIRPVINAIEATLVSQATVASNDPAVEAAVTQLVAALGPALQVAAMDIADRSDRTYHGGQRAAHKKSRHGHHRGGEPQPNRRCSTHAE